MKAMGKRDRPRHSHDSGIWSPNRHNGVGPRHQIYCKIKKQNRCEHIPTSFYIHTEKKIRIYTFAMEKKFITTNSIHSDHYSLKVYWTLAPGLASNRRSQSSRWANLWSAIERQTTIRMRKDTVQGIWQGTCGNLYHLHRSHQQTLEILQNTYGKEIK